MTPEAMRDATTLAADILRSKQIVEEPLIGNEQCRNFVATTLESAWLFLKNYIKEPIPSAVAKLDTNGKNGELLSTYGHPAAAQDAQKLSGLRGIVKTDKSSESIVENSHKQWNDQSAGQDADKPVAWWNGISERNSDFNTVPSWALKEDTNHDIPLYAHFNPLSDVMKDLAAANARAAEADALIANLQEIVKEFYEEWPGGLDEIKASWTGWRNKALAAEQSLAAERQRVADRDEALAKYKAELAALKGKMG